MYSYRLLCAPLLIIGFQLLSGLDCAESAAEDTMSNAKAPTAKQQGLVAVNAPQQFAYQGYPQQPRYEPAPAYYYQPYYGPLPPRQSGSPGRSYLLYYALSMLIEQSRATTTPTTGCSYGSWSTCSSACLGKQTRLAVCSGITTTQSQDCNTQLGFQSTGWYRAANCYDYSVSGSGEYEYGDAKTACEGQDGRLASSGMRDTAITFEVMEAMLAATGEPVHVWIGADRTSGEWVWSDGVTAEPNVWSVDRPGTTIDDHIRMTIGSPTSGTDKDATDDYHYLCERAAQ